MQVSLCSKQKQMQDYFKSSPRASTPSKDVSFMMVADATKDVSLVDSLDMDDLEFESIDTTIASVAASALMKETPTHFSTPKHPRPLTTESSTPLTPSTSTSTATPSQPPAKKLKLNLGLSCPQPKILLSMSQVIHKIMNNSLSGSLSACSSDSESGSSQE